MWHFDVKTMAQSASTTGSWTTKYVGALGGGLRPPPDEPAAPWLVGHSLDQCPNFPHLWHFVWRFSSDIRFSLSCRWCSSPAGEEPVEPPSFWRLLPPPFPFPLRCFFLICITTAKLSACSCVNKLTSTMSKRSSSSSGSSPSDSSGPSSGSSSSA